MRPEHCGQRGYSDGAGAVAPLYGERARGTQPLEP